MRILRSKSNFMYGCVLLAAVLIFEFPAVLKIIKGATVQPLGVLVLVLPLVVALYMFVSGCQMINISDRAVTLELVFLPLKDIEWAKINEAGTGKIKIGKDKYSRQLYVSTKKISEKRLENLESMKFDSDIIWFDYSLKAQDSLAKHLGVY